MREWVSGYDIICLLVTQNLFCRVSQNSNHSDGRYLLINEFLTVQKAQPLALCKWPRNKLCMDKQIKPENKWHMDASNARYIVGLTLTPPLTPHTVIRVRLGFSRASEKFLGNGHHGGTSVFRRLRAWLPGGLNCLLVSSYWRECLY